MGEWQEDFMAMEMNAKIYMENLLSKGKSLLGSSDASKAKKRVKAMEFQICNRKTMPLPAPTKPQVPKLIVKQAKAAPLLIAKQ